MAFNIRVDTTTAVASVNALTAKVHKLGNASEKASARMQGSLGGNFGKAGVAQLKAIEIAVQGVNRNLINMVAAQQKAAAAVVAGQAKSKAAIAETAAATAAMNKKARESNKRLAEGLGDTSQQAAILRSSMSALGTSFGMFTAKTLVAATTAYAFVRAIKSTVSVGAELENAMQRVFAVTGSLHDHLGVVTSDMKLLSSAVRDVAKGTIFTATEVAQGAVKFAQAGFTAADTASALNATASLAAIGMTDMATAAGTATTIINSFGLEATALQGVVDTMAVAVVGSMMDIKQLGVALSFVGPLAKETNTSFKETVIILELMHDAGVKASKAGTSLRRGMVNLLNPSTKQMKVLRDLGVSTTNAAGEMRSMLKISQDLANKGIKPAQVSMLFGARAVAAWTQVINEANGKMNVFIDAQKNIAGQSLLLRKQLEQNLTDQFKILVSAIQEVQQVLFNEFGPKLTELVVQFKDWVTEIGSNKEALISMAAAGSKAVLVFAGSIAAITAATALAGTTTAAYLAVKIKLVAQLGLSTVASNMYAMAQVRLTAATVGMTTASGLLAKSLIVVRGILVVISKHPIIAAMIAAGAAFLYFRDSVTESSVAADAYSNAVTNAAKAQENLTAAASLTNTLEGRLHFMLMAQEAKKATEAVEALQVATENLAKRDPRARRSDKWMKDWQKTGNSSSNQQTNQQEKLKDTAIEVNRLLREQVAISFDPQFKALADKRGQLQQAGATAWLSNDVDMLGLIAKELDNVTRATRALSVSRLETLDEYIGSKLHSEDLVAQHNAEVVALKLLKAELSTPLPRDIIKENVKDYKALSVQVKRTTEAVVDSQQHLEALGQSEPFDTLEAGIASTRRGMKLLDAEFQKQRAELLAAQRVQQTKINDAKVVAGVSTTGDRLLRDAKEQVEKYEAAIKKLEAQHGKQSDSFIKGIREQIQAQEVLIYTLEQERLAHIAARVDSSAQRGIANRDDAVSAGQALDAQLKNDRTSKADRIREDEEAKLAVLAEYRQIELDNLIGQRAQTLGAEAEFEDMRTQIQEDAAKERLALSVASFQAEARADRNIQQAKVASAIRGFADLSAAGASSSKKMFKINKEARVAGILMDTPAAISGAFTAGSQINVYAGYAMAALAAVNQATLLQQAKSTTFGGGGSVSAPSGGGGGGAVSAQTAPAIPPPSDAIFNQTNTGGTRNTVDSSANGGGNLTVNFKIDNVDAQSLDTLLERKKPLITRMIQDSYTERGRRGGPIA